MKKTLVLTTIALTAIGVGVRMIKDVEELKFKLSSTNKLSTKPGISEIDRLDKRIDEIPKQN